MSATTAATRGQVLEMYRMALAEAGFPDVDIRPVGPADEVIDLGAGHRGFHYFDKSDDERRAVHRATVLISTAVGLPMPTICEDCYAAITYAVGSHSTKCEHQAVSA
jgi:hypothetical protein